MKRKICPNCGGVLITESIGWRCKKCRGFISLQDGKFYEYVGKPFMPTQTNGDRIRSMTDEELAEFLTHINPTNCQDCAFSCGWKCQPDRQDYSDTEKCKEGRKRWLQQPAKAD